MEERVIKILREIRPDLSGNGFFETISSGTDIIGEVNLSSLQMINFMFRIEEEFNVEIDFDNLDISKMRSIGALCDFIRKCKSLA